MKFTKIDAKNESIAVKMQKKKCYNHRMPCYTAHGRATALELATKSISLKFQIAWFLF